MQLVTLMCPYTPKWWTKCANTVKRIEKLLASGLHMVDISIDAFLPETYAEIRCGGKLEITRANVLKLMKIKKRIGAATRIVVSFVEQPQNTGEVADLKATGSNKVRTLS